MKWKHGFTVVKREELFGVQERLKLIEETGQGSRAGRIMVSWGELGISTQAILQGKELVSVLPVDPQGDEFYLFFKYPAED